MHVIPKITKGIRTQPIDITQLRHINSLHLADPSFNLPGKMDSLLGADVLEVMLDNRIKDYGVVIREPLFGWIVSGPIQNPEFENNNPFFANALSIVSTSNTGDLISKFWELESVLDKKHLSRKERECESHYDRTTERKANGRSANLGLSKAIAMKRFLNLEKNI